MEAGTHISIPLVYDLLLNQEIILLSKFKKFNKNELLNLIYQMKFKDFLRTNNILARTNFNPNNKKAPLDLSILVNKIIKIIYKVLEESSGFNNVTFKEITKTEIYNNIALYVKTSSLEDNRECFETFVKSFYMDNNNIPEISGTARVYVRTKFDKAILNNKLKKYFSFPFYLRERFLFIKQNPNTKELFLLAQKKDNDENTSAKNVQINTASDINSKYKRTFFKVLNNTGTYFIDLNNKKFKPAHIKKNEIITKDIVIKDDKTFKECLSYFINKIFLVKQKENIYTIAGTEKDIYYFEKMIK